MRARKKKNEWRVVRENDSESSAEVEVEFEVEAEAEAGYEKHQDIVSYGAEYSMWVHRG